MKMGNLSAIWISPSLAGSVSLDLQCFGDALVAQLGQTHGIEQLTDRRLQLLHGSPQVAAKLLRASSVVEAAHDVDRPLERADDLPDGDVARVARQYVPSLGSVLADDQPALGESLQDLSQELGRDAELFRNPLRANRSEEHTSELQSQSNLVCRLLLEKKKKKLKYHYLIKKKKKISNNK